ncbi:MAG: carbohydrate ABC transporter permease [Christensenellales bacterium]|nr:carbohydrate ABC transporter permease [Clostridiales bacterium]MDY4201180.1 carbohydrate ABC transporter permease [Candidatus Fimadaptatus sp.]
MKKQNVGNDRLFYALVYIIAIFAFVITLWPFLYIVAVSFSGSHAVYQGEVFLWPVDITLDGYRQVFKQNGLWTAYGNTLFYTTVGTVFNLAATTIAAYPLSRNRFFARRFFNFFIAFTMYFSGGMIPTYLLITKLGFYNSRWVMIIPSLLSTYNVMVCRSAFSAIPDEVIESAEIDGSNEWQTFGHIAVRLITPTLAVLTLYYAVGHWNNFFTALLYLSKEELMPMQVLLRRVLIQASSELMDNSTASNDMAAVSIQVRYVTIVVATLPILAIYPLLQKYFVKGVMLGAVKG